MLRKIVTGALALAVLAPAARAAERRCDIEINVVDQDAAGMNVRGAPGGVVIGALKAKGRWVQVHLVGQDGDHLGRRRASLVDTDRLAQNHRLLEILGQGDGRPEDLIAVERPQLVVVGRVDAQRLVEHRD